MSLVNYNTDGKLLDSKEIIDRVEQQRQQRQRKKNEPAANGSRTNNRASANRPAAAANGPRNNSEALANRPAATNGPRTNNRALANRPVTMANNTTSKFTISKKLQIEYIDEKKEYKI